MVYSMPSPNDEEYNKWLGDCTENEEMPFFNKTTNSYECYPILELGPCEPQYWFVLDQENPTKAVCAKQTCACENPEYTYDSGEDCELQYDDYDENRIVYNSVMFNGKCSEIEDGEQCPYGQIIYPNTFGIGDCGCSKGFLPHFDENEKLSCYQEYLQGPCAEDEQYVLSGEENGFKPICKPTNCDAPNKTRYKNTCFTVPVCKNEEWVEFKVETKEARCKLMLGVRGLIGGQKSCKKGQKRNARGECKKTIKGNKGKGKRSPSSYGGGKRLRQICCS